MGFISVLIIIVSILLILVVLIQNSKGGGIASNFTGTNQVVGVKRQAELIERITWILAGALLVLCLSSSAFNGTGSVEKESIVKSVEAPTQSTPNTNSPVMPQQQPQQQPVQPSQGGTGN
ncbi:MAG: preprotein translocase subunit SecG [Bacteroidota bacterium]